MRTRALGFRLGLGPRLILIVVGVSLLGMVASTFFMLALHRDQLIGSARLASERLGRATEASLVHAMLTNDQVVVDQMVQSVAMKEHLQKVAVLASDGSVRVSSVPEEVGGACGWVQSVCGSGHGGMVVPNYETNVSKDKDGQEVLLHFTVIRNEPRCYACHEPDQNVLGAILIERPLADVQRQLVASLPRIYLPALATFILLVGLMIPALHRSVTAPVHELSKALGEIGQGNLDYPVEVKRNDELGDLALSLDAMREQLQTSHAEMASRSRELALLNHVALAAGQLLDPGPILELALDTVIDNLGLEIGMVFLCDEREGHLVLSAARGLSRELRSEIESFALRQSCHTLYEDPSDARSVLIPDVTVFDQQLASLWGHASGRAFVSIHLRSRGLGIGLMSLFGPPDHVLGGRDLAVLEAVGHEISIAIDNALLLAQARQREQEATALSQLGTRISGSLDLAQVLEAVTEGARALLGADIGLTGLVDEETGDISIRAVAGTGAEALAGLSVPVGAGTWGHGLALGQPLLIPACSLEGLIAGSCESDDDGSQASWLAAPLKRGDRLQGMVGIVFRQERRFLPPDVEMLTRLSQHVAVAIENARLYGQVRHVAILEERDRLAREMHDNFAQALGYINLKSSVMLQLLQQGQSDEVAESLRELKQVAQESYTDVRETIFSLRAASSLSMGLLPMLRTYLPEYRAHYGVFVELVVEDESLARFLPETEIQVTRIVQEALTNVRKHAKASQAWVRIGRWDGHTQVTVKDNGQGFDLSSVAEQGGHSLGLQIMRERARAVGGRLEIQSQRGQGTCIEIYIPSGA